MVFFLSKEEVFLRGRKNGIMNMQKVQKKLTYTLSTKIEAAKVVNHGVDKGNKGTKGLFMLLSLLSSPLLLLLLFSAEVFG